MRRRQVFAQAGNAPRPVAHKEPERDLVAEYIERFGEKPHHRLKPETIKERLDNDDFRGIRA